MVLGGLSPEFWGLEDKSLWIEVDRGGQVKSFPIVPK